MNHRNMIYLILSLLLISSALMAQDDGQEHWLDRFLDCENPTCQTVVLLETALPDVGIGNGYISPNEELVAELPDAIEAFADGDIGAAIEAYEAVTANNYHNPMLYYSLALLYEVRGDLEAALENYHLAIEDHAYSPLLYFSRGMFHAGQAEQDLAAYDFFMMSVMNDSDSQTVNDFISFLTTEYAVDLEDAGEWSQYPTFRVSRTIRGNIYRDLTTEPAQPVQLLFDEDNDLLLMVYGEDQAYVIPRTEEGYYEGRLRDYWGDSASEVIHLTETEDGYAGWHGRYVFEGGGESLFVLLPPDDPDPREDLVRCPDGFVQRIEDVAYRSAANPFEGLPAYDEPGGEAITTLDSMDTAFEIVEGAECVDGIAWWRLDVDGALLWVSETDDTGLYLLNPSTR
jgi:tetratricopeptide (TPR) repeat protein